MVNSGYIETNSLGIFQELYNKKTAKEPMVVHVNKQDRTVKVEFKQFNSADIDNIKFVFKAPELETAYKVGFDKVFKMFTIASKLEARPEFSKKADVYLNKEYFSEKRLKGIAEKISKMVYPKEYKIIPTDLGMKFLFKVMYLDGARPQSKDFSFDFKIERDLIQAHLENYLYADAKAEFYDNE